jgi:hypothetical protein
VLKLIGVAVDQEKISAGLGQPSRDGGPNSSRRAGDHGVATFQTDEFCKGLIY